MASRPSTVKEMAPREELVVRYAVDRTILFLSEAFCYSVRATGDEMRIDIDQVLYSGTSSILLCSYSPWLRVRIACQCCTMTGICSYHKAEL